MLLWYLVLAVVGVWAVFDSPALDYRLVMVGAVLPVAEIALGRPGPLHSLVTAVIVLALVMLGTRGRRIVRRRLLGLPIGLFAYLVLSGTWADTDAFWWPLTGLGLSSADPPELARGGLSIVLDFVAVGVALWWSRRVGLDVAEHRRELPSDGTAPPPHGYRQGRSSVGRLVLIIVRHGRTEHNRDRRLLGRLDVGLDDLGRSQAAALARHIGPVDRVISSPLRRTRETAAAWALPVDIDERWIELDYGDLDGVPLADVDADLWRAWRSDLDFTPPGGESLAALGTRVRAACDALRDEAAERDVVVVSHVSPIKAAVAWGLGVTDDVAWRMFVAPASVTRLAVTSSATSLHGFNLVDHLADLG